MPLQFKERCGKSAQIFSHLLKWIFNLIRMEWDKKWDDGILHPNVCDNVQFEVENYQSKFDKYLHIKTISKE